MKSTRKQRGFLQIDMVAGIALLTIAIIPLGYSFAQERSALRRETSRAAIIELLDGEMEVLAAGAAKNLPDGAQDYPVTSPVLNGVPPGHFTLTKTGHNLELDWSPAEKCGIGTLTREAVLK
jgi:hypothetical protein